MVAAIAFVSGCDKSADRTASEDTTKQVATEEPEAEAPAQPKPLQIGAVLPLTGPGAVFAQYIKQGMDLARDELADAVPVELLYEDSKTSPKDGISAYNKLVSTKKPPAVVVALSAVAKALSPLAAETDTVQVYIAVAIPEVSDGKRTFLLYPEARSMAGVMAGYASTSLKAKTAAVIYINDDFGRASLAAFKELFGEHDGRVVFSDSYELTQTDYRQQLLKLKAVSPAPDIIYLNGYGPAYGAIIRQIKEAKLSLQVTADMTIGLPSTRAQVGDAAEGVYYVDGLMSDDFMSKFKEKYAEEPSSYAGYAYDIVTTLAKIHADGDGTSSVSSLATGLRAVKDKPGAMGKLTITENGSSNLEFVVRQVRGGKPTTVNQEARAAVQ